MHDMHKMYPGQGLLRAEQVRQMLGVDRSTVYRMAENGRLPAMKIGRQWRFPADQIGRLLHTERDNSEALVPPSRASVVMAVGATLPLLELAAEILGVMIVVADMRGEPLTEVINPCQWFAERSDDPELLGLCLADWKGLADDPDFEVRFHAGPLGVDCARAFLRVGPQLVGMLIAGCISPSDEDPRALYRLGPDARAFVLRALPTLAARVSRVAAGLLSELGTRDAL